MAYDRPCHRLAKLEGVNFFNSGCPVTSGIHTSSIPPATACWQCNWSRPTFADSRNLKNRWIPLFQETTRLRQGQVHPLTYPMRRVSRGSPDRYLRAADFFLVGRSLTVPESFARSFRYALLKLAEQSKPNSRIPELDNWRAAAVACSLFNPMSWPISAGEKLE